MIIEDSAALKIWLENVLKSLCEADPHALALYVLALIKKNKPEDELKKVCQEQLEVFLQNKTVSFVDDLFSALNKKIYKSENHHKRHKPIAHFSRQRSSSRSTRSNSPSSNPRRLSRSSNQVDKRSDCSSDRKQTVSNNRIKSVDHNIQTWNRDESAVPCDNRIPPVLFTNAPPPPPLMPPFISAGLYPTTHIGAIPPPFVGTQNMPYPVQNPNIIPVPFINNFAADKSEKLIQNFEQNIQPAKTSTGNSSKSSHIMDYRSKESVSNWGVGDRRQILRGNNNHSNFSPTYNTSSTILVTKIPTHLNNIGSLNEHFSLFGTISNIKICYNNRRDSALIEYNQPFEAQAAYRSPKAILSNRFIRVYLHNATDQIQESSTPAYEQSVTSSSADDLPPISSPKRPPSCNRNSADKFVGRLGGNIMSGASDEFGALADKKITIPALLDSGKHEESNQPFDSDDLRRMKKEEAPITREKQIQEFENLRKLKSRDSRRMELLNQYHADLKSLFSKLNEISDPNEKRTIQSTIKSINKKMIQLEEQCASTIETSTPRQKLENQIKSLKTDIQNKKSAGEDVSHLCKLIVDLKRQLLKLDSISRSCKSLVAEPPIKQRKLDNRSKVIYISGHNFDEADDLKKLLLYSKFEIDSFENINSLGKTLAVVNFISRQQAEMAIKAVTKFKGKPLILSFNKPDDISDCNSGCVKISHRNQDDHSIGSSPIDPLSSVANEDEIL